MDKAAQARKNRRAGKAFQGKCAKLHGAKNVGGLGGEDNEHPVWSIEAKKCARFAGQKFMDQAVANCPLGKIPIVHVHLTGENHDNDLIITRFKDWRKLYEQVGRKEKAEAGSIKRHPDPLSCQGNISVVEGGATC